MVEVYVHFLGFLWLLAVALFLEIELQLLAKLKKIVVSTEILARGLLPQVDLLIPMCVKQRIAFYLLVPPFNFLAKNASGVLMLLTNVSILPFLSPSYTHHFLSGNEKASEIIPIRC